ncbi:Ku protein [Methylobacterium sp. C25]|uniref:non-homologous end joining protein Ku n=1 Tax=Methylobacterium sp. C25 TaxID=2721622 RepID=UPI001F305DDE|nr:Ku protein [Methylobacterium sp. C25]MCE4223102.1 Ku protein [Methylobacterium sp. C25]
MAARANWKGHLRLSLVSCSVGLYPAVSTSSHLKCHTINRETGNRIKQLIVDSVTEEPVDREDQIKGCEVAKDELVPIEGDELDEIALESTHTINIEAFCRRSDVDERYLDRPYYLAAEDKVSREAFAVIRDAMKKKGMAGLGRLVIYRRERVVLLEPYGKGLLATLLRYHDEIRSPTAYFEDMPDGKPTDEMRSLAEELIDRATRKFDPKTFEDRYEGALIALVQGKASKPAKGAKTAKAAAKTSGNVVNLMEALKRSIASEKSGAAKSEGAKTATKTPARSSGGSATRKTASRKPASRKTKKAA